MQPVLREKVRKYSVLEFIAKLSRRGASPEAIRDAIPETFGIPISLSSVKHYLNVIKEQYRKSMLATQAELVAEKAQQYADIRLECWKAYELSMADREQVTTEYVNESMLSLQAGSRRNADGEQGRTLVDDLKQMRRVVVQEGRIPANTFLQLILRTLEAECELFGINAAKVLDVNMKTVSVTATLEQILIARAQPDAIQEKLNAVPDKGVLGDGEGRLPDGGRTEVPLVREIPSTNGHAEGLRNGDGH